MALQVEFEHLESSDISLKNQNKGISLFLSI